MAYALRRDDDAIESRQPARPEHVASGTYLPELEGLRGVAIVVVLLYHCEGAACLFAGPTGLACSSSPLALLGAGHTGVSLFLVLSAFLLSLPLFQQAMRGETVSLRQFYRRRALRILPLYWGVLVVGLLLAPSVETLLGTLQYAFFLHGLWPVTAPGMHAHVAWSLATEVQFYAVLPLLFVLGRRLAIPLAVALAVTYALLMTGAFGSAGWRVGHSIVGRSPLFLCGIGAAWVYARFGQRLSASRPLALAGDAILIVCFVALELLLRTVIRGGYAAWEAPPWVAWHAVEGPLWALVVLLVVSAPLRLRALFRRPALMWLGVMSYSIYLLHWPFLLWAGRFVHSPLVLATGGTVLPPTLALVAVVVAFSPLVYRFVERPFLLRKSRVRAARRQVMEPSIARAA